jgi:hypothetical protein
MLSTGVLPGVISEVGHVLRALCSAAQRSAQALVEQPDMEREQQLGQSRAELDPTSILAVGEHADVTKDDFGLRNADDFVCLNKLLYGYDQNKNGEKSDGLR